MLISAFARRSGMTVDTVRYYMRRGLLKPEAGRSGGRNPYQEFSQGDLDAAGIIRTGQALGLDLKTIGAFIEDYQSGQLDNKRLAATLSEQRDRLRQRANELENLARFLGAKIAWVEKGRQGPPPELHEFTS
jgi:MerR family transcriptional regulator, copper efflux regulator